MKQPDPNGLRMDSESDIRNGLPHTYRHTDGDVTTAGGSLTAVDARATESEFTSIGDVFDAGLWPTGERHPVVRWGEREEIPLHKRVAIMYRDRFRCQLCPKGAQRSEVLHLDHIKPWSAGGSDRSDNLRLLCEPCNVERSNYVIPNERPAVPVTWWCNRCYLLDEHAWNYATDNGVPECPRHGWISWMEIVKPRCRVQRGYLAAIKRDETPTWHRRRQVQAPGILAYCAHCNVRSLTDVTL